MKVVESEELYLDIVNNTSDLIQCLAPDGSFLYTNNAWQKAMGYTAEELKSLTFLDVLHPESKACCQGRFERLLKGESLSTIDFKFVTKSGATLHLLGDCGSIIKNGESVSTRGIFKNVTKTVLAEQALKESEARYQALYNLAPDIYTTIDSTGTILSINRTGVEMLGYSKEELVGKSAAMLIHPEDRDFAEDIEYRKIKKDGGILWVHQGAKLDTNASEPRLLVVCRDITAQRELRSQLAFHATHDSLTQLINRRELERRLERVLSEICVSDNHALCFLDLDDFKIINDTHGHAAGDELLKQITTLLREHVRSRDTLARLGGDEFVVLMEHCSLDVATKLAEKIQSMIAGYKFHWLEKTFSIGVSIGVTALRPGASVEETLGMADAACYKAKNKGRNCIHIHTEH
jgi:diguanylate cyclase (GGDEF)-like protein/PAS domain S-box-containing protein